MIQAIIHTDSLRCSEVFQITRELKDLGYGCPAKVTHRAVTYRLSPENLPEDWALDFDNLCPDWEISEPEKS